MGGLAYTDQTLGKRGTMGGAAAWGKKAILYVGRGTASYSHSKGKEGGGVRQSKVGLGGEGRSLGEVWAKRRRKSG